MAYRKISESEEYVELDDASTNSGHAEFDDGTVNIIVDVGANEGEFEDGLEAPYVAMVQVMFAEPNDNADNLADVFMGTTSDDIIEIDNTHQDTIEAGKEYNFYFEFNDEIDVEKVAEQILDSATSVFTDAQSAGLSDDDYMDPEDALDDITPEDYFDGNESYRRAGARLLLESKPAVVVNDDLDSFDRQDKYDAFTLDTETLDTSDRTADDWFAEYEENDGEMTYGQVLSTLEAEYGFRGSLSDYTYDEACDAIDLPYSMGDTRKLPDVDPDAFDATGEEYDVEDPDSEKYEFGRIDRAAEIDDSIEESYRMNEAFDGLSYEEYEDAVAEDLRNNPEFTIMKEVIPALLDAHADKIQYGYENEVESGDIADEIINSERAGKWPTWEEAGYLSPVPQYIKVESCCDRKKGKKKSKKFVPFWAKKKLDEATVPGTFGPGSWDYSNDRVEIHADCYAIDDDEDAWPYQAEVLVEFTDPEVDPTLHMGPDFYAEARAAIKPVDSMDDSYNDGEKMIGKYNFFFKDVIDVDEIVKTLAGIAYSKFDPRMKDFDMYDDDEDIDESYCGKKNLDETTGFDIAFDDTDYYTEDEECETCVICGKECCGGEGEYNEDGDFVCTDCAENSLERPMEEIDPMDIYFRAGRADNIRDMRTFVRSDDDEDIGESCCGRKKGKKKGKKFVPFWTKKKLDEDFSKKEFYRDFDTPTDYRNAVKAYIGGVSDKVKDELIYAYGELVGLGYSEAKDPLEIAEQIYAEEKSKDFDICYGYGNSAMLPPSIKLR